MCQSPCGCGGTDEDVVHVAYGYGLFTGGFGLNGGSQKVGSLTLPMSSGNTDRQLQFMTDLGSTILCCTPSYASYLAESIEERGIKDQIKLKAGIFGAEAWSEDMRADIENRLGIKAYVFMDLLKLKVRVLLLNARNRMVCIFAKTILFRKLLILTHLNLFLTDRLVN